jgi:AcrR family transcriptional regulator
VPRGEFDRSPRRAQTRARLLEAAARVYARRGFEAATLDEVADEAGYTKGAVYDHFGSKENLLLALLDEHLAAEIASQLALFDPTRETWQRPRAGSDAWMHEVATDPQFFRLFVETWVHAQRDERLRERLANGNEAFRAMFRSFAERVSADAGLNPPPEVLDQFASVQLGLSIGLAMIKLIEPERVSERLLGATLSMLVHALETSDEARAALAEAAGLSGVGGVGGVGGDLIPPLERQ